MARKWLCALGILFCLVGLEAQQRWVVTAFPLPNARSGISVVVTVAEQA